MNVRSIHLLVGGLGLLLFVLQGQYMALVIGVEHLPDAPRMMYRSSHIYLLLAGVANVSVGYYLAPNASLNYLQRLVSVILLLAPMLLVWSFVSESNASSLDRPIGKTALYLLFGSATVLVLHEIYRRFKAR